MEDADLIYIKKIKEIRGEINCLNPDDQESLIKIGACLESLIQELPQSSQLAAEAIGLSLEGLQAIYNKEISNPAELVILISRMTEALEKFLTEKEQEPLDRIKAELKSNLSCGAAEENSGISENESDEEEPGERLEAEIEGSEQGEELESEGAAGEDTECDEAAACGNQDEETAHDAGCEEEIEQSENTVSAEDMNEDAESAATVEDDSECVEEEIIAESQTEEDAAFEDINYSDMNLNDVAALLIQFETTDARGLEIIRDALSHIASRDDSKEVAGILADQVTEIVATSDFGDEESVIGAHAEIGKLLEKVLYEIETLDEADTAVLPEEERMETEEADDHAEVLHRDTVEEVETISMSEREYEVETIMDSMEEESECEDSFGKLPEDTDADLMNDFITECRELIQGAEAALLTLETDPEDQEAVNTVFRAFHTVKGTSAFLGLNGISELAHSAENLMSRIRDGEMKYNQGHADLSLRAVDMLTDLIQNVEDALGGESLLKPEGYDDLLRILSNPEAAPRVGDILVAGGQSRRDEVESAALSQGKEPIGVSLIRSKTSQSSDVGKALRTQRNLQNSSSRVESSVRVRTDRLDSLIDMVGELVIAHSMVSQDKTVQEGKEHELVRKVAHTGKIVRELQDLCMAMRMVPLKGTFQKMTRLVRDLARKGNKKVNFITEGVDTEIDRNMVDVINDPLIHMMRNSVDHGIESPDERQEANKPEEGLIKLSAYHSGGNVVVEVTDDGAGINKKRVLEKALSKGVIEKEHNLTDNEIYNLIFEPGFSTAEKITGVSGRGVGMDVVKKNIEKLRGRIDITSHEGKGTRFTLRLPLTLAITDGMLVKVGDQRYIMPTVGIHMTFRPEPEAISPVFGRGEMVMFRKELLPVIRLHKLFEIDSAIEDLTKGLLVVVGDKNQRSALLVDELLGQQQVVAKSLGKGIDKIEGIAGGAILGDGRVGLILDPVKIASIAKKSGEKKSDLENIRAAA